MILTTAIQKGGTGKTATAATLAQAATSEGRAVLAVDMDPQGQLTYSLGADANRPGTYEFITGEDPAGLIQKTEQGVYVIPASWKLSTLPTERGSARKLRAALAPIRNRFHYILIDSPPSAGELQYNAIFAADGLIIPVNSDVYSLQSLHQITAAARQIQKNSKGLFFIGVILTMYDARSTLSKQLRDRIREAADRLGVAYLGEVRRGIAIQEAAFLQKSLYEYAPRSKPAADYFQIYKQITEQQEG